MPPLCLSVFATLIAFQPPAAQPWELLRYAPPQANSVLTINVARLLASPRAVQEGWANQDHVTYLAGAVPLSPTVERVVVAKAFDPDAPGHGAAVAILPARSALDLTALAAKLGGTPTTIGDEPAVRTANGGYLVPLADNVLGATWGGNKSQLAGWVRVAKVADKSPLSRTLNSTVAELAGRNQISLVIDVADLIDPARVVVAVFRTTAVEGDMATADRMKAYLNGLRTVTLTANVSDRGLVTRLALTSSALPTGLTPEVMKSFLLELFDRNGTQFEDFVSASSRLNGRTFSFEFRLSDPELAAVTHLFLPPLPAGADAASIPVAPAGATIEATSRYFRAVNQRVDELRRRKPRAVNESTQAVWYDSAANAIAGTSVLAVDPLMADYGLSTAGRLRAVADSLRGLPIKLAELEDKAYLFTFGQGGRLLWGGWNQMMQVNTNLPEIRAKQMEAIRKDEANRAEVWKQIDAHRAAARKATAEKFGTDPDRPR